MIGGDSGEYWKEFFRQLANKYFPPHTDGGPPEYSRGEYQATKKPTVMFSPQAVSYTPLTGTIPDDYLTMSLLTIFFCFWPLGVVALLKSLEVR